MGALQTYHGRPWWVVRVHQPVHGPFHNTINWLEKVGWRRYQCKRGCGEDELKGERRGEGGLLQNGYTVNGKTYMSLLYG